MDRFSRTALLLGEESIQQLKDKHICIFGIGGVGGFVTEALARSGIGNFDLVDKDVVSKSNLNRQIIALSSTMGRPKTEVMRERILDINPNANVSIFNCFFLPENAGQFDFKKYDYIIDAVDTVTAKLEIIIRAKDSGVPIISSMGAGNKLDPTKFCVADIYETSVCPLAKVMRRELRKRDIKELKVVYSTEEPRKPSKELARERVPGSVAWVPSVAGLIIAGEVIRDLIGEAFTTPHNKMGGHIDEL